METIKQFELKKIQTDFPKIKITKSEDSNKFIRQFYSDDLGIYESFFILLVNRASYTIGYAKISQGGIAGTIVDIKLVSKYAIESLCSGVIVAHNHPSGNTNPSNEDKLITNKIKQALNIFDIQLMDHIILTEDSYYSFADEGII
jgi:DNA repair protein RadC